MAEMAELFITYICEAHIALLTRKKLFRVEGLNAGDHLKFSDMTLKLLLRQGVKTSSEEFKS